MPDLPVADGRPAAEGVVDGAMVWTDATERRIAEVWGRILSGRRVDRDTSILNMRVGFLQIHRFLAEIEKVTGASLPLTSVFQAPTIPMLADAVRSGRLPVFDPVIPFKAAAVQQAGRDGSGAPPLFLLPGLGGSVFMLFDLARLIRHPGGIFLNQQGGLDGRQAPHRTIPDMVRFQLDAIRAVQPSGPYLILGYSLGGTLALEVARQLIADGEAVPFVGMVEPYLPERYWPMPVYLQFLMRRAAYHAASLRGLSLRQALGYAAGRARALAGRIGQMFGNKGARWSPPPQDGLPPLVEALTQATHEAVRSYRIRRFDGKVTLFLSQLGDPLACDPLKAWPRYLAEFDLVRVPGGHLTMVSGQNAKTLAARVSEHLDSLSLPGATVAGSTGTDNA